MTRVLIAAVALGAFSPSSRAGETVVRLNVRPMAAPKPALKYQLLPELRELNPGNAAQNYLKCFMEQRHFFFTKEAAADRVRYQTMPLAKLPLDTLRQYGGSALRQADWAARLDALDWQTLERVQNGGIEELPAELGPLQLLAAALQVRFRAEVAGRQFDDAIRTAKTMFALARHLGEHATELADLVGLSVAQKGSSLVALNATVPQFVSRTAQAAAPGKDNILVVLEMTGGNDGLNTVIPYADDLYHKARPTLRQTKSEIQPEFSIISFHFLLQSTRLV
ncbi:MAG: hypothetical protein ACHRXM_13600 [Isosphaerales bacterium]